MKGWRREESTNSFSIHDDKGRLRQEARPSMPFSTSRQSSSRSDYESLRGKKFLEEKNRARIFVHACPKSS